MPLDKFSPSQQPLFELIVKALRRHTWARSVTYGIGMNAIGFVASRVVNPAGDREWSMPYVLAVHSLATPFMVALTYGFTRLREEDIDWWNEALRKQGGHYLVMGVALGSVVYLVQTGVALTQGWVSFDPSGWQRSSEAPVGRTLLSHLANICVAWNEEMLYRGYGLYSLTAAIGLPGAVALLIPLFAWGHGSGWQTFIGQSALGLSTTALKLASNSLWLPVGYHAAWNYMQTAVLGPPDAAPSLLPMRVEGSRLWMGRPGYPEPGLLSILTNFVIAAAAFLMWWRSRGKNIVRH